MARVDNTRGLSVPYRPASPGRAGVDPAEFQRAVWEELERISISLAQLDQPVVAGARTSERIPVGTTITWSRLFNEGFDDIWVSPPNTFDRVNGVYTCAQEGVYSALAVLEINAFDAPGNRQYSAGIRTTVTYANGDPASVSTAFNGGSDATPVNVTALRTGRLYKGDKVFFDAGAIHDSATGTTPCRGSLQIQRLSSAGNNTG